jgi:hypothetical protein
LIGLLGLLKLRLKKPAQQSLNKGSPIRAALIGELGGSNVEGESQHKNYHENGF